MNREDERRLLEAGRRLQREDDPVERAFLLGRIEELKAK